MPSIYSLYSKKNKLKEIRSNQPKLIDKKLWLDYISNHEDFTWYIDSPLGQLDKNHPTYPLDPELYYVRAYYKYNKKKGYSNVVIEFFLQHCRYIVFQYPRITIDILNMMWEMANALDCHLVKGRSIVSEEKFEKIKAKYSR